MKTAIYKRPEDVPFHVMYEDTAIECKAGNIELNRISCEIIEREKLYVCGYSSIYQINYSKAQNRYYAQKIVNYKGLAKYGKFHILSGIQIFDITKGEVNLL
jgi:hypothetical protein